MRTLALILFLILPLTSLAYIPKLSTVLTRISANNGATHPLVLEKSVVFKDDNLECSETWYVENADSMKLVVSGKNEDATEWSFELLYKNGKRQSLSTEGEIKSFPLSSEFFEQLLHYRNARALQSRLEQWQILPANTSSGTSSSYVTLDRYRGSVVYRFGAQESKSAQPPPLLVVEQDSFIPKRLRLGTQTEVEFSDLSSLDEGAIKQPTQQTILWKNTTVITKIKNISKTTPQKMQTHLKFERKKSILPTNNNVKEFYSRFR